MPAVHILKKPAAPVLRSFEFGTYNEAAQFAQRSAALNPSRPQKRIRAIGAPVWAVVVVNRAGVNSRAEYATFPAVPGFTGLAPACCH